MDNTSVLKSVAGDHHHTQQHDSAPKTVKFEDQSAAGHEKKGLLGSGGDDVGSFASKAEEARAAGERKGGDDTVAKSTGAPPFTEGYGTTGSHESGDPGEKQHGFAAAV